MSRRYIVTALGPDGKVIVSATHDAPIHAIAAVNDLMDGDLTRQLKNDTMIHKLLKMWLTGADTLELLTGDFNTTVSLTIIDE